MIYYLLIFLNLDKADLWVLAAVNGILKYHNVV